MFARSTRLLSLVALAGLAAAQEAGEAGARPSGTTTASPAAGLPVQDARSSRVDYDIHARLDGESKRLDGRETIRWTNRSGEEVSDLWFHLYLNAFSNNRTTHLLGAGRRLRGADLDDVFEENWWSWQQVESVKVDGLDVTESFRYRQPDTWADAADGAGYVREDDRTVFSVDLPRPVRDGQTVAIEVVWKSQLPRVRRRTGYKGDFLLVAQWFPKLGVYEGGRGWNCHQFHASTEFYSNYGTYRVTLDLPAEYDDKVGASGVQVQNLVKGDRVQVVYEAPSLEDRQRPDRFGKLPLVHDFTWTGDPDYVVERQYRFSFEEWVKKHEGYAAEVERVKAALGPDVDVSLRDVNVTVMIHPEREGQAERHFAATAHALFFYGLWFGEYPYEHVTVVDPAWGARAAGGMEYPTLFTCGTRLFTTPDMYTPESVTVHECGHQFWYGLVGNNEFENAWMDEGFNSFTDSEALVRAYGPERRTTDYFRVPHDGVRPTSLPSGGKIGDVLLAKNWHVKALDRFTLTSKINQVLDAPLRSSGFVDWWRDQPILTLDSSWNDPRWGDRNGYLNNPQDDPVRTDAWKYVDRGSYRTNSYPRPAALLRSLIGVLGVELAQREGNTLDQVSELGFAAFLRGMRHYSKTWRYRHPYPDDFFAAFVEGAGVDVGWYFEDGFRSTRTIDWSVSVSQRRAQKPRGLFQGEDGVFRPHGKGDDVADEEPEPVEELVAEEEEESDEDGPRSDRPREVEILLQREGELCLPLAWRVVTEHLPDEEAGEVKLDDRVEQFVWTRQQQLERPWLRRKYELDPSWKVKSVVLDPARVYYVDEDMSDNQWFAERDRVAPLRWTDRVLQQYGHLLHWYAGLGG